MFGLFSEKSPIDKLVVQHKKLLEEAYKLSVTNRSASDSKTAEAHEVLQKIEQLKKEQ